MNPLDMSSPLHPLNPMNPVTNPYGLYGNASGADHSVVLVHIYAYVFGILIGLLFCVLLHREDGRRK